MCLSRSIKAYLCPNIIYFDAVDFSERRSEELTHSVYQNVTISYRWVCVEWVALLTNAHMKLRIQFIIIKIFVKRVKICSKSPRFTVPYNSDGIKTIYCAQYSLNIIVNLCILFLRKVHVSINYKKYLLITHIKVIKIILVLCWRAS